MPSPILCRRLSVLRSVFRTKKYYRSWKVPYSLEDPQTFEKGELNPYDAWIEQWNQSGLPRELRAFDPCLLPGHLKARIRPASSFFEPRSMSESTLDYKRRLFGQYGIASGVDPGILFIDAQTLQYEQALERATERPVKDVLAEEELRKAEEAKQTEVLMTKIKANLAKMPQLIEQHESQKRKEGERSKVVEESQKAIMEEARDRFGYYLSPRDPKFIKLRAEIEEREKLARKEQKKAAKQKKTL